MSSDHSRHILFGALAVSVLLHLLLVFGWGWARPQPAAASQAVIQVLVSARAPSAPVGVPAELVAEKQAPVTSERQGPPATPPVMALQKTVPQTEPARADTIPASTGTGPPEHAGAPPPLAADSGKPGVASAGVSAEGLRQYRIDLASAARRFRHYPAVARSRAWQGEVELSLTVTADKPAPSVKLVRSSGYEALDEQALEMLTRAAASTPLPESLRGQSFVVPMPIKFNLAE